MQRFGVPNDIVEDLRIARPDEIVWMGRVPARIDFLQFVPGLDFATSWERRVVVEIGGVPIYFIGREDLLINKRAVGRPQDLRDVKAIERAGAASTASPRDDKKTKKAKRRTKPR